MSSDGMVDDVVTRWVDFDGPVHLAEFVSAGAPDRAEDSAGALPRRQPPALVLAVHGLGGSWVNWLPLLPRLGDRLGGPVRVLAVDLPGFGLSVGAGRAHVDRYVEMCAALIRTEIPTQGPQRAVVLGNSMGGLVTMLLAAKYPRLVSGAALLDTAMLAHPRHRPDPLVTALFGAYFVPLVGPSVVAARRRLRTPEQLTADTLRMITADSGRIDAVTFQAHVDMARRRRDQPGAARDFAAAARSMLVRLPQVPALASRMEAQGTPVLVLHGARDRLVPAAAARELAQGRRGWSVHIAPDVGHVPQLEVPDWTATRLQRWWPQ